MHVNGSNGYSNGYTSGQNTNQEEELDLLTYFNLLLLKKWVLIGFIIVGVGLSYAYYITQLPVFRSSGTLMMTQNQNRYSYAGSDLSNLLTTTYGIGVGSSIANELQILTSIRQSEELASRILENPLDENGNKYPILWREYPEDSTTVSRRVIASRYRAGVSFDRVDPQADLIRITYSGYSPLEAAYIVNLTMETYSDLSSEQNRFMASSAIKFLNEEQDRILNQLKVIEDSLRVFMNETQLISVSAQSVQIINQLAEIEARNQEIEVQLVAINSTIYELEKQLDEIRPGLSDQFSESVTPLIDRFQFKLAELETERLLLKIRNPNISDENQELVRLNNEIDAIKSELNELTDKITNSTSDVYLSFITSEEGSMIAKLSKISENLVTLKVEKEKFLTQQELLDSFFFELEATFDELPDNMMQLARLERDVEINARSYEVVSTQLSDMTLWEKTQFGMGQTLDAARPRVNPVWPRVEIIFTIGLFFSGFIGISFIIIRDMLDDKITSTDHIKDFNLPILGTIPDFSILQGYNVNEQQFVDEKSISNQLITFIDHISPISEAYRRLRINVVYANPDKHYNVIMVTSANKGEGKSTVASNLAITFSESEKSVLIIDLDLRRPTQHKVFGENREPGLTDSLFEIVKLSEIINSTIAPNVDLLTVGKKTPEPANVLDSKRLKQLIDRLKDKYDHIILDTAPYGIISDSASLLRLVDGLIVVSRFNTTTKRELTFTLDGLHHLKADVLGLVLNAFNPEKSTDYYTNYAYYKRTYYSDYYKEGVK